VKQYRAGVSHTSSSSGGNEAVCNTVAGSA
jgi:hypothetical protein